MATEEYQQPVADVNNVNIVSTGRLPEEEAAAAMEENAPSTQRPALDPHADQLDETLDTQYNRASGAEVQAYEAARASGDTTIAGRFSEAGAHANDRDEANTGGTSEIEPTAVETGPALTGEAPAAKRGRPARG